MKIVSFHTVWKLIVFVVGVTVVLLGVASLFLPAVPGWLLIFVGLGVLGGEFAWARWLLRKVKREAAVVRKAVKREIAKELKSIEGVLP